jgi:hypothetical protein
MTTSMPHKAALGPVALATGLALLCAQASASPISPLPRSNYSVSAVCAAPAPRHAACLSLQLVPRTAQAAARTRPIGLTVAKPLATPSPKAGDFGLRPQDVHSGYALPTTVPVTQTIALVDAYNDPSAEADLKIYDEEFGLPECTVGNGCFAQVNQNGNGEVANRPFPKTTQELENARRGSSQERKLAAEATGWALEISLDVQAAHATCQSCRILLVEASSSSYKDLETAEHEAAVLGASEISNSWGGPEEGETPTLEASSPFNHPGIVITASAGDNGYLGLAAASAEERGFAEFPATSPHVVAVGGTRLLLNPTGNTWQSETVWNDSGATGSVTEGYGAGGGGCSEIFTAPAWQQSLANWTGVGCGSTRSVADAAADADPYSGLAVHDTSPECEYSYEQAGVKHVLHWCTIGGTSLSSPLIAAVYALAGGAHGVEYPARTLYEGDAREPASLHDVTAGSNGPCLKPFNEAEGTSGCTYAEEAAACSAKAICWAGAGYDGPTGIGTPNGIAAFRPPGEGGSESEKVPAPKEEGGGETKGSEPATTTAAAPAPNPAPTGSTSGTSGGSTGTAPPATIVLSALALTPRAVLALNHGRAKIAQVAFSFTLSAVAQVRVTLAKRVRTRKHGRWQTLRHSLTVAAAQGRNRRRLVGRGVLTAGVYRLTLSPSNGVPRSIVFRIG